MIKKKKWNIIIHETYELLFKASNPSVDFNVLLENATINSDGMKEIPFMDYEIEGKIMDEIMDQQSKKYKLKHFEDKSFRISIYLGCSPKTKLNGLG